MEWITDRLPTEADADADEEVEVQSGLRASETTYFHWSMVKPGMAWAHTPGMEWASEPATPEGQPVLSVGQRWKRRDGEVVTVDSFNRDHEYGNTHPFWAGGLSYRADGIVNGDAYDDLVELVEPAPPAAKPTLATGQRWKRRDGEVVTVDYFDCDNAWGTTHPFLADGLPYTADGIFGVHGKPGSRYDLVELIEPATEPEPATTPRRFASISRTVWMDHGGSQCHTLDAIADDGTAWWMVPGETEWQELPALPDREAS